MARALAKPEKLPLSLAEGDDGFDAITPLPWDQAWAMAEEHVQAQEGVDRLLQTAHSKTAAKYLDTTGATNDSIHDGMDYWTFAAALEYQALAKAGVDPKSPAAGKCMGRGGPVVLEWESLAPTKRIPRQQHHTLAGIGTATRTLTVLESFAKTLQGKVLN